MKVNRALACVLMVAVALGTLRAEDARQERDKIRTNEVTGLGCRMKADRTRITEGEEIRLQVDVKSERIERLYLYFAPSDAPNQHITDGSLPKWQRIQVRKGKPCSFGVEFRPPKAGTYTFVARVSSEGPYAAVVPFQAFSEPLTLIVGTKPQQEDRQGR